jgi:AAA ATPase-like protein
MSDIGDLTGQSAVLRQILDWIESPSTDTLVLEGPPGCGKTWVTDQLQSTNEVTVLFAAGDRARTKRDLFPFNLAIDRAHVTPDRGADFGQFLKDVLPEASKGIPFGGAGASHVLQNAFNHRAIDVARRTRALGQEQRDVVLALESLAKTERVLLVADDIQWWDDASLDLLSDMMSGKLTIPFPFLSRTYFLLVVTPKYILAESQKLQIVLDDLDAERVLLNYCDESVFGAILLGRGLRNALDPQLTQKLYRISGGHLSVVENLVSYLNGLSSVDEITIDDNFEAFCRKLIHKRFTKLGKRGSVIRDLLASAAVIGLSFTLPELQCLTKSTRDQLHHALDDAKALSFISGEGQRFSFTHDLLSRLLEIEDRESQRDLHERFAACLRLIRPGDYAGRASHLERAGDKFQAGVMAALAYATILRQGHLTRATAYYQEAGSGAADSLQHFVGAISAMQRDFDAGNYADAISAGDTIDEALPSSLLAERDILSARCRIKLLSRRDREIAVETLSQWDTLWLDEPEVWARVALARIIALIYVDDVTEAKSTVKLLSVRLRNRAEYDPDIQRVFHRLMLKADVLYVAEAAHSQLTQALRYFGPSDSGTAARDPLNYYIGLCNLISNELYLSNFREAYMMALRCDAFYREVQEREGIRLPRPDILANNLLVSGYRSSAISAEEALSHLQRVVATSPSNDLALLVSNKVAFSLLSGQHVGAVEELKPWFDKLSGSEDFDEYYRYYIGNNLVSAYIASDDLDNARLYWSELVPLLPYMLPALQQYLRPRHELLTRMLEEENLTFDRWETGLVGESPPSVGPGWKHIGHGLLLSDLQFWSED